MTPSRADATRPQRISFHPTTQSDAGLSTGAAFAQSVKRSVGRGDLLAPGSKLLVHRRAATRGQLRAMLHHAGGDRGDVRDVRTAQLERIAGALRPRFLAVGKALRRGQRRQRQREAKHQADLANLVGESGGHFQLPLAARSGPVVDGSYDAPACWFLL